MQNSNTKELVRKDLFNTQTFGEELSRAKSKSSSTMELQFLPSRDLLTEFSGYLADACWNDAYDSILEEFPNIVSVSMIKNPKDKKHETPVGSSLLIETESRDGQPMLVIRGLNPRATTINNLNVEEFYKKTTDYLRDLAENNDRELAIVIDGEVSGGASTNRQDLFEYLAKKRKKMTPISLTERDVNDNGDYVNNNFNEYDITSECYLIE